MHTLMTSLINAILFLRIAPPAKGDVAAVIDILMDQLLQVDGIQESSDKNGAYLTIQIRDITINAMIESRTIDMQWIEFRDGEGRIYLQQIEGTEFVDIE